MWRRSFVTKIKSYGERTAHSLLSLALLLISFSLFADWGQIRIANQHDILSIMSCNQRNLPENYDLGFYRHQLSSFPHLNLIVENAEHFPIGYAIGRVILDQFDNQIIGGHLVSIAIEESYRNCGIGTKLMDCLHHQWAYYYPTIDFIDLHVRPSNGAAVHQYRHIYGYEVHSTITEYYLDDNEDALLLRLNNFPGCLKTSYEEGGVLTSDFPLQWSR
jgi:ribosomal protein S18 acetylase RimI-like enzyme